ncbi:YXWGXW repeat-containing protein [Bryocella elongata]|uniref:YXWGXW repeat-containing protein n=1 Tax=Bryocella elongata TaxID=863522 RepID=A0A1H6BHV8_9BACT|nr:YXWGXW repeat-containing protein [Bryocella elongata]SEG59985.1 YXWGXW repeat-containing protein [Bryocella elongata]
MISLKLIRNTVLASATALGLAAMPIAQAHAEAPVFVGISIGIAPPALPVYAQPPLPGPGYLWVPGYWAWGDAGYYWVPGYWSQPPQVGLLWTPAWWGWEGGAYVWHGGYWGPHVGFYGGVNYGFGYGGIGFAGGEWRGGGFFYNSAVVNVGGAHITNVYVNRTVVVNNTIVNNNHVSFNGGNGGIQRQPSPVEQQAMHENHFQPTAQQTQHQQFASQDRAQLASVNHGRPATFASANPGAYRAVAQQHAQAMPISAQDRQVGKSYNPNTREANQDQRIANGLKSGQMTSGEAARAEGTQSRIDSQVARDRAANGGTLTNQERNQINREQNGASRQIYNDNHNGATVGQNQVNTREANQEQRIANGQRTGQMTSAEAGRAQNTQSNIAGQTHNERVANGGALNNQQRQQVNREQNGASRQIYNENHNGQQTRPAPQQRPAPKAPPAEHGGEHGHR